MKTSIYCPSFDGLVPAELSSEHILPDVYPDVKRILRVTAKPAMIRRYHAGKRLEFSGAVDYIILFAADTESGETLHCVHFAGEWSSAVTDQAELDGAEIIISPRVASCTARLANPRKLSLKSSIVCDVRILRQIQGEPSIDHSSTEPCMLERLTEAVQSLKERAITLESVSISENLELDNSMPQIDELITCNAKLHFHDARPIIEDGTMNVSLKGEAHVDCIYRAIGGGAVSLKRRLPLSYNLDVYDCAEFFVECSPESLCCGAMANIIELNAEVGENGYGERGMIELDMTFEPMLHLMGAVESELTLDAFSCEYESECQTHELDFSSASKQLATNFSVGESVPRADFKLTNDAQLIDAVGEAEFKSVSIERGRAIISGEATLSCIYKLADGALVCAEPKLPLRCELPCELREPISMMASAVISDIRPRLDTERLNLNFEVSLALALRERTRKKAVAEVKLGSPIDRSSAAGSMLLYYPTKDESAWQIAKHYHVPRSLVKSTSSVMIIPQPPFSAVMSGE